MATQTYGLLPQQILTLVVYSPLEAAAVPWACHCASVATPVLTAWSSPSSQTDAAPPPAVTWSTCRDSPTYRVIYQHKTHRYSPRHSYLSTQSTELFTSTQSYSPVHKVTHQHRVIHQHTVIYQHKTQSTQSYSTTHSCSPMHSYLSTQNTEVFTSTQSYSPTHRDIHQCSYLSTQKMSYSPTQLFTNTQRYSPT